MKDFFVSLLIRIHRDEAGQGLVEYLLVLALVAFAATAGTILRSPMGIDFHAHHAFCIRFFSGQLVDFAFQLVGLFTIEPPRFASPL